jgi:hypothetical protein
MLNLKPQNVFDENELHASFNEDLAARSNV